MQLQEKVLLSEKTTYKTGGPAKFFAEVGSETEIIEATRFAKKEGLPIFILAGGSNIIVASGGFNGLVIQPMFEDISIENDQLHIGASVTMKQAVDYTIKNNCGGLEWAGGLPGTVGGAICGNAGCFGREMKDIISMVTSFNYERCKKQTRTNEDCQFGYRESIFKKNPTEIILRATIGLISGNKVELRKIADSHINYRQEKHPMEYPSAGSIFKNTPLEKVPKNTLSEFESLIKNDPFPVIPTAAIIARADCQGLTIGGAQLSTKHTNYIVNLGGATGEDIVAVIEEVKKRVKEKFGIVLEIEPQLLGF